MIDDRVCSGSGFTLICASAETPTTASDLRKRIWLAFFDGMDGAEFTEAQHAFVAACLKQALDQSMPPPAEGETPQQVIERLESENFDLRQYADAKDKELRLAYMRAAEGETRDRWRYLTYAIDKHQSSPSFRNDIPDWLKGNCDDGYDVVVDLVEGTRYWCGKWESVDVWPTPPTGASK